MRKCAARSRTSSRKSTRASDGVIEDQARAVEDVLDLRQLHRQAALADLELRDALRLLLALLLLQPLRRRPRGWRARTTTCGESAAGWRRSASCGGTRVDGADAPARRPCPRPSARPAPTSVDRDAGSRNETRAPGRRELDADEGRKRGRQLGADRSYVQRQPVGDDLRTGVAVERRQRAVDGREGVERAVAVERSQQRLQLRLEIGVGQRALVGAATAAGPRSRRSDDSASRRRDSSSRSPPRRRPAPSRRRGAGADRSTSGRRSAAAAPRRRAPRSRLRRCRRARARRCRPRRRPRVRVGRRRRRDRGSARRRRRPALSGPKRRR